MVISMRIYIEPCCGILTMRAAMLQPLPNGASLAASRERADVSFQLWQAGGWRQAQPARPTIWLVQHVADVALAMGDPSTLGCVTADTSGRLESPWPIVRGLLRDPSTVVDLQRRLDVHERWAALSDTDRRRVLALGVSRTQADAAQALGVSIRTVHAHTGRMLARFGACGVPQMVEAIARVIDPPEWREDLWQRYLRRKAAEEVAS